MQVQDCNGLRAGSFTPGVGDSCSHTIDTYFDNAGQVVAVTETDTQNSSNATNYQYSYDQDGRLLTSRMAPGDLTQSPTVYTAGGSLTRQQRHGQLDPEPRRRAGTL